MARTDGRGGIVLKALVVAMVGVAVCGASLISPPAASGGTDVVGVAATADAILLTGLGVALCARSAIRLPDSGTGGMSAQGIRGHCLGIVAVSLAEAVTVLAARPSLPHDPVTVIPLCAYLLAGLVPMVGMTKRVIAGTVPRLRNDPAKGGRA